MIETTLLSAFLFTFGIQVGGILRDRQYWRSVGSQVKEQMSSPWYGPQVLAGRIHADQDVVGDMPKVHNIWAPPKRMPCWVEMSMVYERWRVPKVRRAI